MADYFAMPALGQTMEEGTIVRWLKQEGDRIEPGDILVEILSDKASFEVESPVGGVLRHIFVPADEVVPVHAPLAILGTADESIDGLLEAVSHGCRAGNRQPEGAEVDCVAQDGADISFGSSDPGRVVLSPRARRLADARSVPVAALAGRGTGPKGRVLERDVEAYLISKEEGVVGDAREKRRVTPLAARIADDLGIDLQELARGLPGSRIVAEDVRRLAENVAADALPVFASGDGPVVAEVVPFRGLRRMIADNVARSRQVAPHVTLTLEVDMTEAMALHTRLMPEIRRQYHTRLTLTDLLIKAAARALADHPYCNAALVGDEIRLYADKNVGVAVATDRGLLVPVVRHADTRRLGEVSVELKALAERCREGKPTAEDLSGGTFTLTNLGAFGIDVFDPILVPPQSCILGVGRVTDRPVVVEKEVVVRPMMNLCLSFDHRVLDGVPAARFLQGVKALLEAPWLVFV